MCTYTCKRRVELGCRWNWSSARHQSWHILRPKHDWSKKTLDIRLLDAYNILCSSGFPPLSFPDESIYLNLFKYKSFHFWGSCEQQFRLSPDESLYSPPFRHECKYLQCWLKWRHFPREEFHHKILRWKRFLPVTDYWVTRRKRIHLVSIHGIIKAAPAFTNRRRHPQRSSFIKRTPFVLRLDSTTNSDYSKCTSTRRVAVDNRGACYTVWAPGCWARLAETTEAWAWALNARP